LAEDWHDLPAVADVVALDVGCVVSVSVYNVDVEVFIGVLVDSVVVVTAVGVNSEPTK